MKPIYFFMTILLVLLSCGLVLADENITFTTTGSTFQPNITVTGSPTILWTYSDSTTSDQAAPSLKNFGSAATRNTTLKVTPWSAVTKINLGYAASDGGAAETAALLDPQYVSNVYGLENVESSLQVFCACNVVGTENTIPSLNLSEFANLSTLELYHLTSLHTLALKNNTNMSRLCAEMNSLEYFNIKEMPNIADLRGALQDTSNQITFDWGTVPTFPNLWHICIRENYDVLNNFNYSKFPALREFWTWNIYTLNGAFNPVSTSLTGISSYSCQYTSANLSGCFPNPATGGQVNLYRNNLTDIDLSNNPGLESISIHTNHLNQTVVDKLLHDLDAAGREDGILNMLGNWWPSGDGFTHLNNLTAKGWDVTYDDHCLGCKIIQHDFIPVENPYDKVQASTPLTLENVRSGSCIAVFVAAYNTTSYATIETPTDNRGHTYTACSDTQSPNGAQSGRWFYTFTNTTQDVTITGHFSWAITDSVAAYEISGIDQNNTVTFNNSVYGASSTAVSTTTPQIILGSYHTSGYPLVRITGGFHIAGAYPPAGGFEMIRPVFFIESSRNADIQASLALTAGGIGNNWFIGLKALNQPPTLSWANPANITYGTALNSTQLNAESSIPGNFTYVPANGTILSIGTHILNATFIPTDIGDYNTSSINVTINVTKMQPSITWNPITNITYPTAISSTQNSASANVEGTHDYYPANGAVLSAGTHTLGDTFTPTDSTNYSTVTANVTLGVDKATPPITWTNPADITAGTALSSTQLNAEASVPGELTYAPMTGTILSVGNSQALTCLFTPTDTDNYTTATATVSINVLADEPSSNPPIAAFTSNVTNGTVPLTVSFTGSNSGGTADEYNYSFGDGSYATTLNATHTYNSTGLYNVSLWMHNSDGVDTETKTNYITVSAVPIAPTANFTANQTTGQIPMGVRFTSFSTNTTGYNWSFGDNTSNSTLQNPIHVFTTVGNFTVILTASNSNGTNTTVKINYITTTPRIPITNFYANKTSPYLGSTGPITVHLYDSSKNSPTNWTWNLGDGNTSTSQNPIHTYYITGGINVSLNTSNAVGSSNVTKYYYIYVPATTTDLTFIRWWLKSHMAWWNN